MRGLIAVLALVFQAACVSPSHLPPVPEYSQAALDKLRFKAILVAGDPSVLAFDNAAKRFADDLIGRGRLSTEDVRRLTARDDRRAPGIEIATVYSSLSAIEDIKPTSGQGCLIFATAHGAPRDGLALPRSSGLRVRCKAGLRMTPSWAQPVWRRRAR